jgi:hypothetical protein
VDAKFGEVDAMDVRIEDASRTASSGRKGSACVIVDAVIRMSARIKSS